MNIKTDRVNLSKVEETIQLSLLAGQDTFTFILSPELLSTLSEQSTKILNPEQLFNEHIKRLKEFKRQVFTHYKTEKDPIIKQQKLDLYIESKKIVEELENKL
jgi:hypothetical protein